MATVMPVDAPEPQKTGGDDAVLGQKTYTRMSTNEETYFDKSASADGNFYSAIASAFKPWQFCVGVVLAFVVFLAAGLLIIGLGQPGEKTINAIGE